MSEKLKAGRRHDSLQSRRPERGTDVKLSDGILFQHALKLTKQKRKTLSVQMMPDHAAGVDKVYAALGERLAIEPP